MGPSISRLPASSETVPRRTVAGRLSSVRSRELHRAVLAMRVAAARRVEDTARRVGEERTRLVVRTARGALLRGLPAPDPWRDRCGFRPESTLRQPRVTLGR